MKRNVVAARPSRSLFLLNENKNTKLISITPQLKLCKISMMMLTSDGMQRRAKIYIGGEDGLPNDNFMNLFFNNRLNDTYGFRTGDLILTSRNYNQWVYNWFIEKLEFAELMNYQNQQQMIIPLWATNRVRNAGDFYKDVIEKLRSMGMEIRMTVHPSDEWVQEHFCRDLNSSQKEEMARWRAVFVSINSAIDRPLPVGDYIYNAHFNMNETECLFRTFEDTSYGESMRCERFQALEAPVDVRPRESQCDALSPLQLLDAYRTMCKTSGLLYMVFRIPFLQRTEATALQRIAVLRELQLLHDDWVVLTTRFYQSPGTASAYPKYTYLYLFMCGPVESLNVTKIRRAFDAYKHTKPANGNATYAMHLYKVDRSLIVDGKYNVMALSARKSMHPMSMSRVAHNLHFLNLTYDPFGNYYNGPSLDDQWYGVHRRILEISLVLSAVPLSVYVQLWIMNCLVALVHAPETRKLRLIEGVAASMRRVERERSYRRNPVRARRMKIDNKK